MADDWDISDEDTTTNATTTTTTTPNNETNKTNTNSNTNTSTATSTTKKKKKKRKRRKKKQEDNKTENQKKKVDTWSDSDDDKEIPQKKNKSKKGKKDNKLDNKAPLLPDDSSMIKNKKNKKKKKKRNDNDLDDASNDEEDTANGVKEFDLDETEKKSKGLYPIWRPEQNYKYDALQYTHWPDYIERDDILLKVKRKETFVDVISIFESKNGINCNYSSLDSDLLCIYGLNIWNKFSPIYELIGEDNHRPFMMEFDSFLLDLFHNPLISNNLKFGARINAVIDILESYLELLFGGGRSVQIIMFKSNECLWKYPIHFFMRSFIKYYLMFYWEIKMQKRYEITYPLIFEFDSFWCLEFSNYIYQYLPVFASIAQPDLSPFICDENRYLMIYLVFYIVSLGVNCVQSTEITFKSNALYGFSIDIPSDINKFILDRFIKNKDAGSHVPVLLNPLLSPTKPHYLENKPKYLPDLFTNLNFIHFIANDNDKRNIRRLATVYALIAMFRNDCHKSNVKWDFIKLMLLNVVILENNSDKYRSEMLPKLKIMDKIIENNNIKKKKEINWLDLDDSVDEDFEEEIIEMKSEDEQEEEKETKEEDDNTQEIDLSSIIKECWWFQLTDLGSVLDEFMMHCTVFLDKYTLQCDDIKSAHFEIGMFSNCFDVRILCYLLTISSKLTSLNGVKRCLELSDNALSDLNQLYDIVLSELDSNIALYPIVSSRNLLNIKFFNNEYYDYNKNIVCSSVVKNSYVGVKGDLINSLKVDLDNNSLLYWTKNVSGYRERSEFFRKYEWIRGGRIPDGIKPYVYEHRNYMIFQTFIAKYAQSLEGGKVVLRDVIVAKKEDVIVNNKRKNKKDKNKRKYVHKNSRKKINVRLEAELEVRRKERALKLEKISNLIRICSSMYSDLEQRISRLDDELCLMDASDGEAALPGLMKLHEWATIAAIKCDPQRTIYPVVRLWQITFDIFRRFIECVSVGECIVSIDLVHNLQHSLHLMGFFIPAQRIAQCYFGKCCGKYTMREIVFSGETDVQISVGCSYARFMMMYCGPYMIRGVGSRPDARVSGFYPDEWQIKLLDIVDNRESALVVAPTSSGKTFVSYYCMKEILQQNKSIKNPSARGIVVYVSPTKALTWQACADIYSKYGDVFGVLTPDYDHKPIECQVLVCVPESFEKLLMSRQRQQLHSQIKYVIFDEIHCLGRSEGGAIWERLLMLTRSPFLALSATVGAPHKLSEWLNRISSHRVRIIEHRERWSYLEKYMFLPDKEHTADGEYIGSYKEVIGWKSSIVKMHPCSSIGLTAINNDLSFKNGFPPFLTFAPSDCITFYDSMYKSVPNDCKLSLLKLKPDTFFCDKIYITKNDASEYESKLKKELCSWSINVSSLLNSMASSSLNSISRMERAFDYNCYSFKWVKKNFIHLVLELSSTDRLPALVFVLDRVKCEELYLKLLSDLEYLENLKKRSESMAGDSMKEMEIERRRRLKKLEKERKKREKEKKTRERQKKDKDEGDNANIDDDQVLNNDDDHDYRFSLFDRGDEMDSDELYFWTRRLQRKTKWPQTHPLLIGLNRGIGLHHEGLPLQYRHLVETLFRAKHIKLVVSVASLAMGVNMPARSVIFGGDHNKLDPLNYRQMMGRAGRRGYDNIGHVIFFGISPRKISYLMTSQLTSLNGHYPILSTTSSIRCTDLLLSSTSDSISYIDVVNNLFNKPFNYKLQTKTRPFFRYCLELHVQNGLLSPHNNLNFDGLGSLASVLHEYEPNNFLFVYILQCGYLHSISKGYHKLPGDANNKLKRDILYKLMLVLCNIFEIHPLPISYKTPPSKSSKYLTKSHLILPDLDKSLKEINIAINKYRYNFVSHYYNMNYLYNNTKKDCIFGKENMINYIEYFLKYCDGGIFGHNQLLTQDLRGRNMHKNAFIFDFYLHEDYKRIVDEAGLRDGLAWRKLKKFQLLLSIINKSLNDISCLKSKQDSINEEVKTKIEQFEQSLQKLRQHKFSIYRRQQQFWMDENGKLWKKHEIEAKKENLKLQAIGDDFVMAFQDLHKDFREKFRNIVPIGPISNYSQQIQIQQQQQQQQQEAAAKVQINKQ